MCVNSRLYEDIIVIQIYDAWNKSVSSKNSSKLLTAESAIGNYFIREREREKYLFDNILCCYLYLIKLLCKRNNATRKERYFAKISKI